MVNKHQTILHVIDSLATGGAEVLLKNTINLLPQYNHYVIYLCEPSKIKDGFISNNVHFKCLEHKGWLSLMSTINQLKKIIKEIRPALVHAHLFKSTIIARSALPKGTPFFFTIHNILSKDAFEVNKLSVLAEKMTYKKHHTMIGVSAEVLKDYDEWIGIKGRSYVLYNYVDQKFFNLSYNYNKRLDNGLKLLAVGNLRRQKNYMLLLEALSLLKELPVTLDICGEGTLRPELEEKIKNKNLKVRLLGRVENISDMLLQYDAYIMPSLFEGFGIAPMEAMASGMPVLLSDIPVFKEISGDIPVYFDPLNPASIADAIKYTINNWDAVIDKAKGSRALIYKKASQEVYLNNLLQIYTSNT